MDDNSSSNINTAAKFPIKAVIKLGNLTVVSLDKTIVERLGITDETCLQQELGNDGVYLRISKNGLNRND